MPKLILYNIQYCAGTKGDVRGYLQFWKMLFPPKYLDYVMANELKKYNPDIVGLVEVDTGSIRAKKENKVTFFKEMLDFEGHIERVKYIKKGFSGFFRRFPIIKKQANAILSKNKASSVKYHSLTNGTKRVVIEAVFDKPKKFHILLVHLSLGKKARKKQLEQLILMVNSIKEPVILMGDFNIFKGLDEIKPLLESTDLTYFMGKKKAYTQPTIKPTKTLDLILTSNKIKVNHYEVLDLKYSDHLPVMIEFDIK